MFRSRNTHIKAKRTIVHSVRIHPKVEILEGRFAPGATFDGLTPTPIVSQRSSSSRVIEHQSESSSSPGGLVDPFTNFRQVDDLELLGKVSRRSVREQSIVRLNSLDVNEKKSGHEADSESTTASSAAPPISRTLDNEPFRPASFLGTGPLIGSPSAHSGSHVQQTIRFSNPIPSSFAAAARSDTSQSRSVSFKFAVIGNYGQSGTPEADVASRVNSWAPDYVISVGSNNYPSGEANTIVQNVGQYYCPYILNPDAPAGQVCNSGLTTSKFYPAPGDDDWDNVTGSPLSPYVNYFTLPSGPGGERYYDFVQGPIHFFVVDSDQREPHGTEKNSAQAQWLKAGLASATEPWKIVYVHHDPYSSSDVHGSTDYIQWPFQQWGASAVISGNDHVYERIIRDGLPYFVNGLGGHPDLYGFLATPVDGSVVRYNSDWGAMLVQGDETAMTFQFITRTGAVIDTYTINHSANLLIPGGSAWKYNDTGANLGQRWRRINFGDAGWSSAPAELGYGDGDETSVVSYGPDPNNKYITTYFRYKFTVPDPSIYTGLKVHLLYDDGAVVYLNATEVERKHMPLGAVNYLTLADGAVTGAEENVYSVDTISSANLKPGTNVIAVEVHQVIASSADSSFDLALFGITA